MITETPFPRYLRIDRNLSDEYLDALVKTKNSPFYKFDKTNIYVLAAALGYKERVSSKSKDRIDVRLFSQIQREIKWALFSIVISECSNTDVLLDGEKAFRIIEEYANGGVRLLHDKVLKNSLDYNIENEIIKEVEKSSLMKELSA